MLRLLARIRSVRYNVFKTCVIEPKNTAKAASLCPLYWMFVSQLGDTKGRAQAGTVTGSKLREVSQSELRSDTAKWAAGWGGRTWAGKLKTRWWKETWRGVLNTHAMSRWCRKECTPETYITVPTNVTPIRSMKITIKSKTHGSAVTRAQPWAGVPQPQGWRPWPPSSPCTLVLPLPFLLVEPNHPLSFVLFLQIK